MSKRPPGSARSSRGFTVIELLAVLTILGLVASLFLPALRNSLANARNTRCINTLGQIGRATALYSSDNGGSLPGSQHTPPSWVTSLGQYVTNQNFLCPELLGATPTKKDSKPVWNYALNDFLISHPFGARNANFSKVTSIPSPKETLLFAEVMTDYQAYDHFHFAEASDYGYTPEAFAEQVDAERHSTTANYLFIDAHVENLGWSSGAKRKLTNRGSRFVHPAGISPERPVHTASVAP